MIVFVYMCGRKHFVAAHVDVDTAIICYDNDV